MKRAAFRADQDVIDEQDQYGVLARDIGREAKLRAAAEWDAMDDKGQLPEGWVFDPGEKVERTQ